jgi:hypothetical protein
MLVIKRIKEATRFLWHMERTWIQSYALKHMSNPLESKLIKDWDLMFVCWDHFHIHRLFSSWIPNHFLLLHTFIYTVKFRSSFMFHKWRSFYRWRPFTLQCSDRHQRSLRSGQTRICGSLQRQHGREHLLHQLKSSERNRYSIRQISYPVDSTGRCLPLVRLLTAHCNQ